LPEVLKIPSRQPLAAATDEGIGESHEEPVAIRRAVVSRLLEFYICLTRLSGKCPYSLRPFLADQGPENDQASVSERQCSEASAAMVSGFSVGEDDRPLPIRAELLEILRLRY
jgi:hypothetical protein